MPFKKWVEIENHYREKFIRPFFERFPDLVDDLFIVSEKLDGASFSILFHPDKATEFAKRSQVLQEGDTFFNYREAIDNEYVTDFIKLIENYVWRRSQSPYEVDTIQFVGELFGPGINGRVNYGDKKQWRWYAIYIDGKLLTPLEVQKFVKNIDDNTDGHIAFQSIYSLYVPVLGQFVQDSVEGFFENIEHFNIEKESFFTPEGVEDNLIEGVVIRPFYRNYVSPVGEHFLIKYKNEKFKDNQTSKLKKKVPKLSEHDTNIFERAMEYINPQRTTDLFSKHGEISEPSQIGEYIKLYYQDVITDVEKDIPEVESLDKDVRKMLNKSINKHIVEELKGSL